MSSRYYNDQRIVVWPYNIDCNVSKKNGRKLSLKECVAKPKIEEILKAAEILGLEPILEEKMYPKKWFMGKGRVIVLKKINKLKTLRMITSEIKKLRMTKTSG